MSLIKTLEEKLRTVKNAIGRSKIVKGGLAFAMALTIATTAAACGGNHTNTPTDPDHTVTDPSGNTNPTSPNSPYSQILQDVLNSEYYNGLVKEFEDGVFNYSNKFGPIPYAFLEAEGYNINEIKTDDLKCEISSFVKKDDLNTLYLSVKVETKNSDSNYYTNYLLSYPITDKEYEDLCMLHKERYLQSSYFIQELDNRKTAKIENVVKIDVDTFNNLVATANKWNTVKSVYEDYVTFDILNIDPKNLYVSILVREDVSQSIMMRDSKLRELKISFSPAAGYTYNNYLYIKNVAYTYSLNIDEFEQIGTDIVCLDSQSDAINGKDLYYFIKNNKN